MFSRRFAEGYYRKGDKPTGEVDRIRQALRPLKRHYGRHPAKGFGPIAHHLTHGWINSQSLCVICITIR